MQPAAPRVASDTPPRRPLILAAGAKARVDAQGESLVVTRGTAGVQRFPVSRVDRIVCGRGTSWSGDAISLCFDRGISITWVDGRGSPVGDACPRLASPSSLDASLDRFLEMPRWAESYGNWLRRRRMAVLVRWASLRREGGRPVTEGEWHAAVREYVHNGRVGGAYGVEVLGWCRAVAVARLGQAGLRTRYWAYDGQPFELAEDIAGLLWAALGFEHQALSGGVVGTRATATVFEAGAEHRLDAIREHLAQLNVHVCRAIEEWH